MLDLDSDLFSEAVDAWLEHCKMNDMVPQQPSLNESSTDDTGVVTLRNDEGFLARYSAKRKRILTNL